MKQVIFRREARADVREAYRWYEEQESGLGAEFRTELRAAIERIRERQLSCRVLHRETRRARLKRFPIRSLLSRLPGGGCGRSGDAFKSSPETLEAALGDA